MSKTFTNLYVIQIYELPASKVSSDSYIHVLDSCPFQPATTIFKGFDSPYASSSIKTKEVDEHTIHLLFNLKVEGQVYVL